MEDVNSKTKWYNHIAPEEMNGLIGKGTCESTSCPKDVIRNGPLGNWHGIMYVPPAKISHRFYTNPVNSLGQVRGSSAPMATPMAMVKMKVAPSVEYSYCCTLFNIDTNITTQNRGGGDFSHSTCSLDAPGRTHPRSACREFTPLTN
jgi:hypothetical protein